MRASQLVLFALPLVGLAQAVAVRRDNGGYDDKHHDNKHYDDGKDKCEPEKVYVTAPAEKHYVTQHATKTEHKVEYKTVEGPTKYVTKIEHKEGPTKTVEGEKVYITQPPKVEYKTEHKTEYKTEYKTLPAKVEYKTEYKTLPAKVEYKTEYKTVAPSPKCTVTAKPSVWPQPVDCHDGKDQYGDKCDDKAPAPTTYAHWDYKPEHCYTTWDDKYAATKTAEQKPKETAKDDGKKDDGKDHGKDDKKDDGKDHGKDDGKQDDGKDHGKDDGKKDDSDSKGH